MGIRIVALLSIVFVLVSIGSCDGYRYFPKPKDVMVYFPYVEGITVSEDPRCYRDFTVTAKLSSDLNPAIANLNDHIIDEAWITNKSSFADTANVHSYVFLDRSIGLFNPYIDLDSTEIDHGIFTTNSGQNTFTILSTKQKNDGGRGMMMEAYSGMSPRGWTFRQLDVLPDWLEYKTFTIDVGEPLDEDIYQDGYLMHIDGIHGAAQFADHQRVKLLIAYSTDANEGDGSASMDLYENTFQEDAAPETWEQFYTGQIVGPAMYPMTFSSRLLPGDHTLRFLGCASKDQDSRRIQILRYPEANASVLRPGQDELIDYVDIEIQVLESPETNPPLEFEAYVPFVENVIHPQSVKPGELMPFTVKTSCAMHPEVMNGNHLLIQQEYYDGDNEYNVKLVYEEGYPQATPLDEANFFIAPSKEGTYTLKVFSSPTKETGGTAVSMGYYSQNSLYFHEQDSDTVYKEYQFTVEE